MAPSPNDRATPELPPGAWGPAHRAARRVIAPVERFLRVEAASGVVLLVAAVAALAWANSPWRASYAALWHTPLGLRVGPWRVEHDLQFWINDGLMTVFFFVVGLEIRREMHRGALRDLRQAALPLVAALGGMLAPAAIYALCNRGLASRHGWGVPMATDIAFAVGVLTLLGRRVPPSLRVLLLALAVIDDVGSIAVIAIFYAGGVHLHGAAVMAVGVLGVLGLRWVGVRSPWAYVPPAVVVWAGALGMGVHPTLAGVLMGLMTPVDAWLGVERFIDRARTQLREVDELRSADEGAVMPYLDALDAARREAASPVERVQHALHGWVAFAIMPLFALANAGVPLGEARFDGVGARVFVGVALGLALGKPVGVLALSWLAVRLRVATLPRGVRWREMAVLGLVAGIGFTMALFVAGLAFPPGTWLGTAKLAVVAGSFAAALLGLAAGSQMRGAPWVSDETDDAVR